MIGRAKDALGLDPPKLTIDLAKIFGFAPVSFELPLTALTRFFSDGAKDPFGLPLRRWKVWLKGRRDGARGLPPIDDPTPTAYETRITRQCDNKLIEAHKHISQYRQSLSKAEEAANVSSFEANECIALVRNRFKDWIAAYKDRIALSRERFEECKVSFQTHKSDLDKLVKREELGASMPQSHKSPLERWIDILLISTVDILLSFWMISMKENINMVLAVGFSSAICLANIIIGIIVGKCTFNRGRQVKTQWSKVLHYAIGAAFVLAMIASNFMFALWRDVGETDVIRPIPGIPLSPMSFLLLLLNIAVYMLSIHKVLHEYHPSHAEHVEIWLDLTKAEMDLEIFKTEYRILLRAMRSESFAGIESVRAEIAQYRQHIKLGRVKLAENIENLEANTKHWPRVLASIRLAARELIMLYREQSLIRQTKPPRPAVTYPPVVEQTEEFDCSEEKQIAQDALSKLSVSDEQLKQFSTAFENEIVPMVRDLIDRVTNTVVGLEITRAAA